MAKDPTGGPWSTSTGPWLDQPPFASTRSRTRPTSSPRGSGKDRGGGSRPRSGRHPLPRLRPFSERPRGDAGHPRPPRGRPPRRQGIALARHQRTNPLSGGRNLRGDLQASPRGQGRGLSAALHRPPPRASASTSSPTIASSTPIRDQPEFKQAPGGRSGPPRRRNRRQGQAPPLRRPGVARFPSNGRPTPRMGRPAVGFARRLDRRMTGARMHAGNIALACYHARCHNCRRIAA